MKPFYLRGINLLLFSGIISSGYGQSSKLQFEHLTIEQGLSNNLVGKIMQDRKGYIWFGTANGLDKYDGYHFTTYKFDPDDSTSLPRNNVITLYEDKEGIIWVGTDEATSKFDPYTETFTRLDRSRANPFAFKFAQSFNEDAEGNLWAASSFEGELRQIDRKTGKFSAYNYSEMLGATPDNLKNKLRLWVIFKDRKGTIWIGSPTGLHRLNISSQGKGKASKVSFSHYRHDPNDPNSISYNVVTGIYEDRSGILWIVTKDGGLNAFNQKSGKFTLYKYPSTMPFTFYGEVENELTEDFDDNIWIGAGNGLYKMDKERKVLTVFVHDYTDHGSISNNYIFSLRTDKSGILWVATPEGIDKLDPHRKPFGLYRNDAYNPHSLSQNKVAAIWEDKQGVVWVGTTGGGLNALDKKTGQFSHYRHNPTDEYSLRSDTASAVLEDKDGRL